MIAVDTQDTLSKTYKISILPRTMLIDRTGKVIYDHLGYSPDHEKEVTDAINAASIKL